MIFNQDPVFKKLEAWKEEGSTDLLREFSAEKVRHAQTRVETLFSETHEDARTALLEVYNDLSEVIGESDSVALRILLRNHVQRLYKLAHKDSVPEPWRQACQVAIGSCNSDPHRGAGHAHIQYNKLAAMTPGQMASSYTSIALIKEIEK